MTAAIAVRAIVQPGPVDRNKIIGALCVYLLIGIAWAELYQLLYLAVLVAALVSAYLSEDRSGSDTEI